MLLSKVFTHLGSGEFSQLALSDGLGNIVDAKKFRVINHINLAVEELCKRFDIHHDLVTIQQFEEIANYQLHIRYAQSNTESTEPIKYIIDNVTPFVGNVLRITGLSDECGDTIPMNDTNNHWSYRTVNHDTIQVMRPDNEYAFMVTYRTKPMDIPVDADPDTTEVDIPDSFLTALLYYVAGRAFMPVMSGLGLSAHYMSEFENECTRIQTNNLTNTDDTTDTSFDAGGWV